MDYLDDEEDFTPRSRPSRPNPVIIVALLAAAGAAAMLLWMNLGLSNRVSSLEEQINALKSSTNGKNVSKEIADISNQLDSVTKALANHLKTQARNRSGKNMSAMQPRLSQTPPVRPLPQNNFNNRPLARAPIPGRSSSSGSFNPLSSRSLPPPVSSAPAPQYQNRLSPIGGEWVVNITSVSDPESAYQEVSRLRNMGINAESVTAVSHGRTWYRIRVPGFSSAEEARAQRGVLEARLGIRDTWIGRR